MEKIHTWVFRGSIIFCIAAAAWAIKQGGFSAFFGPIVAIILAVLVNFISWILMQYNKKIKQSNELEDKRKYKFIGMSLLLSLPEIFSFALIFVFITGMLNIYVYNVNIWVTIDVCIITPVLNSLMYLYFHKEEKNYINLIIVFVLPILIYGLFFLIYPQFY